MRPPCPQMKLMAVVLMLASPTVFAQEAPAELSMHGGTYPNTCSAKGKSSLKALLAEKKAPKTSSLWSAIETLLCSPKNTANEGKIMQLLAPTLTSRYEGTGEEPSEEQVPASMELAQKLMANRHVWNAGIQGYDTEIEVQYFSNEACVDGVTFTYDAKRWRITKFGGACD